MTNEKTPSADEGYKMQLKVLEDIYKKGTLNYNFFVCLSNCYFRGQESTVKLNNVFATSINSSKPTCE